MILESPAGADAVEAGPMNRVSEWPVSSEIEQTELSFYGIDCCHPLRIGELILLGA